MPKKELIKKIMLSACVYYTVTTFLLIFLFWLFTGDAARAMHPVALMLILPFSACFATANRIFKSPKLARWQRVLTHYAITMAGIFLFLFLPNKAKNQSAGGAFLLLLILTLIYALIMGTVLYFSARVARISREKETYTSVYKK